MILTGKQKGGIVGGIIAFIATLVAIARAGAAPPVVCTPGDEKCIGEDWCRCSEAGDKWIVVIPNATECQITPGLAILYGVATDAKTHLPIQGIVVSCNGYTDTTVADGLYRIEDIPPGTYSVQFVDSLDRYETAQF